MELQRPPSDYTRILVFVVLLPMLILDLAVGLPDGAFVGIGAVVFAVAAGIHLYAGERRAGAGWLLFGGALGLVALVDLGEDVLYVVSFVLLLVAGLVLLASQRMAEIGDRE